MTPAFLQRATRKVNEIGKVKNPTRKYGAWGTRLRGREVGFTVTVRDFCVSVELSVGRRKGYRGGSLAR